MRRAGVPNRRRRNGRRHGVGRARAATGAPQLGPGKARHRAAEALQGPNTEQAHRREDSQTGAAGAKATSSWPSQHRRARSAAAGHRPWRSMDRGLQGLVASAKPPTLRATDGARRIQPCGARRRPLLDQDLRGQTDFRATFPQARPASSDPVRQRSALYFGQVARWAFGAFGLVGISWDPDRPLAAILPPGQRRSRAHASRLERGDAIVTRGHARVTATPTRTIHSERRSAGWSRFTGG
jgi:hypothetical protein